MELPLLSSKQVSRCYLHGNLCQCWTQLHGFCDASEDAYAAVVYLRVQHPDGTVDASIVMSKTRVAPLKRLTITCVELSGALLLSQVVAHVQQVLSLPHCEVHA